MAQSKGPVSPILLWYRPGHYMQGLIQNGKGGFGALIISALFGLVQSFALYRSAEEPAARVLFAGPLIGIGMLYLVAWLMRNFGRWFGARAKISDIRLALGWGIAPWLLAFGLLAWLSARVVNPADLEGVYLYFFVLFLYGYVILLMCLRSALGISMIKTFLCFMVTIMVSLFPLTLIAQLLLGAPPTP